MAFEGGYYRAEFKGFWEVIQGDPLSPTIFNLVVVEEVRHWISLVAGVAGDQDWWGKEVLYQVAFFYVSDGLVALIDLVWLKGVLDTLTGLFDRVGLWGDEGNTAGMI